MLAITQRDGLGCVDGNYGSLPNYFPNSALDVKSDPKHKESNQFLQPSMVEIHRHDSSGDDNFTQASIFYEKILNSEEKERLIRNLSDHLKHAKPHIQEKALANFRNVSVDLGNRLSQSLDFTAKV